MESDSREAWCHTHQKILKFSISSNLKENKGSLRALRLITEETMGKGNTYNIIFRFLDLEKAFDNVMLK